MTYLVLRCIDLYIKPGGFTKDIRQAKRWPTREAALQEVPTGWEPVEVPAVSSFEEVLRDGWKNMRPKDKIRQTMEVDR